ncbi:MAG: ClpXP protease specificity-enhancing factor [Gammaproteobacteria bacterium]|nr:ClpXP protease specificity-enhancing factor [Gammaproteobacteria bacterium]MBU1724546.1 ClpXP protease specificity-enhancing factor [Gammaproteobacteria bacterium]MBU2004589.1 ClpXP protease specificity-enhancing factor [Gammaproteobacteria bacterium]
MSTTPKRPYLLRAFYEWIVDNNMTPHILVDARSSEVSVPRQFVKDGNIVLNVSMTAANNLMMDNDKMTFSARFGGKAFSIWLPMWSIMAIYSRETQEGISFPPDEYTDSTEYLADAGQTTPASAPVSLAAVAGTAVTEADTGTGEADADDGQDEPPPPKPTKRPALRVVK